MDIKKAIEEMKSLSPSENAIETVLKELENSIPKKKIEDKIKELWKEYQELKDEYYENIDKWNKEGIETATKLEKNDNFRPYIPSIREITIEKKSIQIIGIIFELEKICNKF